jgi:exonuclease III
VLVSAALRGAVQEADIYPSVTGSDHCPVSITMDL